MRFILKPLKYIKETKWLFITLIVIVALGIGYFLGNNTLSTPTGAVIETDTVNLIIINDERCKECDTIMLTSSLEQIFPNLEITNLDYNSKKGKKLFEELELQYLPVALFDKSVETGQGYSYVEKFLSPVKDYQLLAIGAGFDPTKEICDNKIDDTGNKKIDCEDEDCKDSMICREEIKSNLQVFTMSDCPYGRKAIEALKEVVDNFGESITYEVHYIANQAGDSFQSLHGQYEVDEDIIQLCTKKHSPEQWLDYIYCRSTKGVVEKDWKDCAKEANVDIQKVEACFNNEGKELLKQDIKIANSLGIGASPTWLANNRYDFGGIDAEAIKQNFCEYNEDIENCKNTLTANTGIPSGQC